MSSLVTSSPRFPPSSMSMDEALERGFFFVKVHAESAKAMAEKPRERDELFSAIQAKGRHDGKGPIPLEVNPEAAGTDMLQVQAALAQYDGYLRTEATTMESHMWHCLYALTASVIFSQRYVEWESEAAYMTYLSRLNELTSDWAVNFRGNLSANVRPVQASLDCPVQTALGPHDAGVLMSAPYQLLSLRFHHPSHGNLNITSIKASEGRPVFTLSCNSTSVAREVDEDDLFDLLSESEIIDDDSGSLNN